MATYSSPEFERLFESQEVQVLHTNDSVFLQQFIPAIAAIEKIIPRYTKERFVDKDVDLEKFLDEAPNKGHVLVFNDDPYNRLSVALSPYFGGPLYINIPIKVAYPTVVHYVEAMRILTASTMSSSCGALRKTLDTLIKQPSGDLIKSAAN